MNHLSRTVSFVVAALSVAVSARSAVSPDATFDVGTAQGAISNANYLAAISVQADDSIVVGGAFSAFNGVTRNCLAKLTSAGAVDTAWDARFNQNGAGVAPVSSVAAVSDGKVVVHGIGLLDVAGVTNYLNPLLVGNTPVRLNSDGTRDTTFTQGEAGDIRAVQNGKLIVYRQYDLRRLNANGTVDETFVRRPGEFGNITVQPDGKLLIFGYPYSGFTNNNDFPVRSTNMFFRLNADGSFDNTFAIQYPISAIASQPTLGTINDAVVQTDGKIIVAGSFAWLGATARGGIARLNSNGTIDTSFNTARGFTQILSIPNVFNYTNSMHAYTVALQADGKVLVGGMFIEFDGTACPHFVRLSTTGTRDTSFDPGSIQPIGWVGLQSTGDILVSGGSAVGFSNPLIGQPVYTNGTLAGRGIVRFAGTPATPQAPVIGTQPENQSVTNYLAETGPTVQFTVAASGTAPFTYQWLFNGSPIANGFFPAANPFIVGASTATLTISNVTPRNAGRYSCIVSNSAGRATSSAATLTVNGSATPDITLPLITVTTPATTVTRVTSNTVNFAGTATDVAGIAGVWLQRDDDAPAAATLAGTAWSATAALQPGTNILRVFARDLSGNYSLTNRRAMVYVVTVPLTLAINGLGTVAGATNQQRLELGQRYTLTAAPAAGQVFSNWTGSVTSSSNVLSFLMASNLSLTANFVPNPFGGVGGTYNGLYEDSSNPAHASQGFFNAVVRTDGAFSGKLQNGTKKYAFTGKFDLNGRATTSAKRPGTNALALELQLDLNGADRLTGTIAADGWVATNIADRAVFSATNPCPLARSYTLAIPGGADPGTPAGHSYGTAVIASTGALKFTGSLADGSPVTQSAPISKDGLWPLYLPAYAGRGSVIGWISFTNGATPDLGGLVSWIRPPSPTPKVHTNGFSVTSSLIGSAFTAPGTGRLLDADTGTVEFTDGNLATPFTNTVAFGPSASVTNTSPNKLALKLVPTTGALGGTATPPNSTRVIAFKGVLLQKQGFGAGYFLGTNESGAVTIGQ